MFFFFLSRFFFFFSVERKRRRRYDARINSEKARCSPPVGGDLELTKKAGKC